MKVEYRNKLIKAMKNGTLYSSIKLAVKNRWPFWIVTNRNVRALQIEDRTYHQFKRKYKNIIADAVEKCMEEPIPKTIWVCWLQGMEEAPDLVKACYRSISKYLGDYNINLITSKNLDKYVDIPEYIKAKWEKGIIPHAQFTDWLRTALLYQNGGIWLDATVYCTGREIAEIIQKNQFFVYQFFLGGSGRVVCSSWLIASNKQHPVLGLTLKMLNNYWKTANGIPNYLFYHIMLTLSFEKYHELWDAIPTYDNASPHILVRELNKQYDYQRFKAIKEMSSFHKLNYKLEFDKAGDTFYKRIITENIEEENAQH